MHDQIKSEIAARRDELVALTQELVRIPSLNPPGAFYRDVCDVLDRRLRKSGFQTELIRAEGGLADSDTYPRWNIVARREGATSGDCVHFNSHVDVVETGSGWTKDPFGGEVQDGKIYGRGTCDMKGGLAASIVAAEAFIDLVPDYAGAIEISGTADEESGGYAGAAYLAERGYFSPDRVQHVIIPEPFNKNQICLGHRGVWWAEIETKGTIAHGSMPFLGDSAVRHMGAVMEAMETQLYPALAERRTDMPVVPEAARRSTLNINSIHGGEVEPEGEYPGLPTPLVPDRCRMVIDRRFLIEEDVAEVQAEIVALLEGLRAERPGFDYEIRELFSVLPTLAPRDAPVVTATAKAIRNVFGQEPDYVVSPGTYDQKHVDRIGGVSNCIAYGPGILALAHQPDEYVVIDDLVESAQVMALALLEILGAPA